MSNFNKLLIIGDSFCKDRTKESDWPVHLGKLIGCEVLGMGRSGCSWWSSRKDLNDYKLDRSSTILIVIHTEATRLPNDYNYPVNLSILTTVAGSPRDLMRGRSAKFRQVVSDFYTSDLFSAFFYYWAQQAWIAELDSHKDFFTTIHIPAFTTVNLTEVKNGVVIIPGGKFASLRDISTTETDEAIFGYGALLLGQVPTRPDYRSNHFNDFNNVKFAEAIADTIKNLSSGAGHYTFKNMLEWDLNPEKYGRAARRLD